MTYKILAAALVGSTVLAGSAFAQTSTAPATNAPAASSSAASSAPSAEVVGKWRVSKLMGVDIYGPDNQKVGDVTEVLVDSSGMAQSIVVGVGGFLGIGEKNVAIPFKDVKWSDKPIETASTAATTNPPATTGSTAPAGSGTMAPATAPATRTADTSNRMYPDHGMITMTKDQLKSAPDVKYP